MRRLPHVHFTWTYRSRCPPELFRVNSATTTSVDSPGAGVVGTGIGSTRLATQRLHSPAYRRIGSSGSAHPGPRQCVGTAGTARRSAWKAKYVMAMQSYLAARL